MKKTGRIIAIIAGAVIVVATIATLFYYYAMPPGQPYIFDKEGQYGIRNRRDIILESKFLQIRFLDPAHEFAAVKTDDSDITCDNGHWGVYDVRLRRYAIAPYCGIERIEPSDSCVFRMIDADGRHFASFGLPNAESGDRSIEMTAHFADAKFSKYDFLKQLKHASADPGEYSPCWNYMHDENPHAYAMLEKTLAMAGMPCSPDNDLTFADAFGSVVKSDKYYRGLTTRALDEMDDLIYTLDGGNQHDMNEYAELRRLLSNLRMSLTYRECVPAHTDYYEEYVAWHNLMEALFCYSWYVDQNTEWYSSKPQERACHKAYVFDNRRQMLETEMKILGIAKGSYSRKDLQTPDSDSDVDRDDVITTFEQAAELTESYHSDNAPEFYHPMWHEIRHAFAQWIEIRARIAQTLPEPRCVDYQQTTHVLEAEYAGMVQSLYGHGLVPALD